MFRKCTKQRIINHIIVHFLHLIFRRHECLFKDEDGRVVKVKLFGLDLHVSIDGTLVYIVPLQSILDYDPIRAKEQLDARDEERLHRKGD